MNDLEMDFSWRMNEFPKVLHGWNRKSTREIGTIISKFVIFLSLKNFDPENIKTFIAVRISLCTHARVHSFSSLTRVKNYMRCGTSEGRLSFLGGMYSVRHNTYTFIWRRQMNLPLKDLARKLFECTGLNCNWFVYLSVLYNIL